MCLSAQPGENLACHSSATTSKLWASASARALLSATRCAAGVDAISQQFACGVPPIASFFEAYLRVDAEAQALLLAP